MCGIAGVFNMPEVSERDLTAMVHRMRYRGPDGLRVNRVGPTVMGQARLAVIDIEGGAQPMSSADGAVWVICNGEIFNFVELRAALEAKGYVFRTRSDTEVLIHLWREKGAAMVDDLIGMFAFFLWDTQKNRGLLARDRQGIKPLYVAERDGGFAFASEIKALLDLPGFEAEVDDLGLNLVHAFNYCLPPRTCYQGVLHFPHGAVWEIDGTTRSWTERTYWRWTIGETTEPVTLDAFAALFDDAVRIQMRSDVQACLFLSGGVDSSVAAAHILKHWPDRPMMAFGLDCTVPGFGEFQFATRAAEHLGIEVTPVTYDETIVPDEIAAAMYHADQPHGDFSFLLLRRLAQTARAAGAVVAYTGDGPDEMLCGYGQTAAYLDGQAGAAFDGRALSEYLRYFPEDNRRDILRAEFRAALPDPGAAFEALMPEGPSAHPVDRIAAYETNMLLTGNNLIKTDRMCSAVAVEARPPFLDHRVSELLARVAPEERVRDGIPKHFLKAYGTRAYPDDFMFRKKSMPTLPIGEWIKGPLRDWAADMLGTLDESRYDRAAATALFSAHVAGAANHTRPLRTLLTTAVWMENARQDVADKII